MTIITINTEEEMNQVKCERDARTTNRINCELGNEPTVAVLVIENTYALHVIIIIIIHTVIIIIRIVH